MPNYAELSVEAEQLLLEIIENEKTPNYWKMRFDNLHGKEETIVRGCFAELSDNKLIKVGWADNYPFWLDILKDGYLYAQHKKEKDDAKKSPFEKELFSLLERAKAIKPPINAAAVTTDINEYNRPSSEWINDVEIFYQRYLTNHPLAKRMQQLFDQRNMATFSELFSCLQSISKDTNCIEKMKSDTMMTDKSINMKKYDVFLSHASKDKISIVSKLNISLQKLGIRIFYDKDTLEWGDKWKERILEGTREAEFAIIVISKNFFGREWTERELNEFLNRQNSNGQKLILPILYNITVEQLKEKYPSVADIQGISNKDHTCDQIALLFARQLIKRLRPTHIQ